MKKKNIKRITNTYAINNLNTYNKIDIDSICADAMRNDIGYYDNNISMSDNMDDIIHSLEMLCDTL